MLKFKEFLYEQEDLVIDDVPNQALIQIDSINDELDTVTNTPFVNSAIFMNTVRLTLERYGIIIPPGYEVPMLSLESESAYALGESGYYVYVVHNLDDDGNVEGYAQLVNLEDLNDLMSSEMVSSNTPEPEENRRYPAARRDDDSGNDAEYA